VFFGASHPYALLRAVKYGNGFSLPGRPRRNGSPTVAERAAGARRGVARRRQL